jgi:hypothetical protein
MTAHAQPRPQVHYLDVGVVGYEAEIRVNGVLVDQADVHYPCLDTVTISEWLVEGSNEIRIRVTRSRRHPEKDPKLERADDGSWTRPADLPAEELGFPSRLRVRLCVGELDEVVEPGREVVLQELLWVPPIKDDQWSLPHVERFHYSLSGRARFAFEDGDVLDPSDPATVAELYRFVELVHADLVSSRLDDFLHKQQLKFRELAPLYGKDAAEAARGTRAAQQEEIAEGSWAVAPLDPKAVVLDAGFGGRVIDVRARDGRPLIRDGSGRKGWALRLYLARIGGQICIVR